MLNKFLSIFLVLSLFITFFNVCYARNTSLIDINNLSTNSSDVVDDTIYGYEPTLENETLSENELTPDTQNISDDVSVSTDYDVLSSDELSVSNIINIFLIVIGIVLVFLGIAIILKLK